MNEQGFSNYFEKHSALADWLSVVPEARRDLILRHDSDKADRLAILRDLISLPVETSIRVRGDELFDIDRDAVLLGALPAGPMAVRVVDRESDIVISRNRNLPLHDLMEWIKANYLSRLAECDFDFSHHVPNAWSSIFVVSETEVVGEYVAGSLRQLTQGVGGAITVKTFVSDHFGNMARTDADQAATDLLQVILPSLRVAERKTREELRKLVGAEFSEDNFLLGYFEVVVGPRKEVRFIDYSNVLSGPIQHPEGPEEYSIGSVPDLIRGTTASGGVCNAKVRVVHHVQDTDQVRPGEILVCGEPSPALIPLLPRLAGLIMDRGGILSHAAIVCRELGLPCLVGTGNATELLMNDDFVRLDATAGIIERMQGSSDADLQ